MRNTVSVLLVLALMLTMCACGEVPVVEDTERSCGVFITLEAADIYTVSFGTDSESGSFENADKTVLKKGTTVHFDFAGESAEGSESAVIDYSIAIYDKDMNVIATQPFTSDFSNMARVDITVTADHRILNESDVLVCGGDTVVEFTTEKPSDGVSVTVPKVIMAARPEAADAVNASVSAINGTFTGQQAKSSRKAYDVNVKDAPDGTEIGNFSMTRNTSVPRGDGAVLSFRLYDKIGLATKTDTVITGLNFDAVSGRELKLSDIASDSPKLISICTEKILIATTEGSEYKDVLFNAGYTETLSGLVSDGHWYFGADGIVFAASAGTIADAEYGCFEFTVDYDLLEDALKPEYLPAALNGDIGEIEAEFSEKADKELIIVGTVSGTNDKPVTVSAVGDIYNIRVRKLSFNSKGKPVAGATVWYCSDLSDGAGFVLERKLAEKSNTMISFTCPDGTSVSHLLSLSDDGSIKIS